MRKLAVMAAAALLFAGTAVAEDKMGSTGEETKEAGQAAKRDVKEGAQTVQDSAQGTGSAAGQEMRQEQREQRAEATENARDRMEKDSWDIDGKISKASAKSLTIQRDNAPAATLHMDKLTKVELDGEQVSASQLKPGQDVKASFNLKGDKPTAVEIKAEKQK